MRRFPARALVLSLVAASLLALLCRVALERWWAPGVAAGVVALVLWTRDAARAWRAWHRAPP